MGTAGLLSAFFSNIYLLGISAVICYFLLDYVKTSKKNARFPPGPTGVPLLGNILQIGFNTPHETFVQLRKKYGDIFTVKLFYKETVVFNGFEVMKDVLYNRSEEVADRPEFALFDKIAPGFKEGSRGLVFARYGNSWKEQRRFTLTTMRNFGMGKKSLEERVAEEAHCLSTAFKSYGGKPFNPHINLINAVSNIICSIAFGDRFEYDDAKFKRLLHLFELALKAESGFLGQLLNEFPFLMNIPWLANYVLQPEYDLAGFFHGIINEHKKTWNPNETRDFIDAFLLEMEKVKDDPNTSFNETNLWLTTYDLFGAGTETTSNTLRWGILFMLLNPDVQAKVHEEIDKVIGERRPTMANLLEMPYTNAVIHEIQRCGDIVPLALPHMTYRDMEINGYLIPKGTNVITNLSSVLKDEKVWEKPYQFYPKHFLDENGKFVKKEAFVPFSAGRRFCAGEQLARMELFLFFTILLQQFTFEIPNKQPPPKTDPTYAFTLTPAPYEICAVPRAIE